MGFDLKKYIDELNERDNKNRNTLWEIDRIVKNATYKRGEYSYLPAEVPLKRVLEDIERTIRA